MTREQLIKICLEMPESFVDYPYGPEVEVIRNKAKKSFALIGIVSAAMKKSCGEGVPVEEGDIFLTVKSPLELIYVLRDQYKAVLPGYYSNKDHWNTIIIGKDFPDSELKNMIALSFELVSPKKKSEKK